MPALGFPQLIREAFGALLQSGDLQLDHASDYDARSFGNAFAVLNGQNLRVRIVRDRGETLAQIAPAAEPDQWYPLGWVVRAVGATPESTVGRAPGRGRPDVERLAAQVTTYLAALEAGLSATRLNETHARLNEISQEAWRRFRPSKDVQ